MQEYVGEVDILFSKLKRGALRRIQGYQGFGAERSKIQDIYDTCIGYIVTCILIIFQ